MEISILDYGANSVTLATYSLVLLSAVGRF